MRRAIWVLLFLLGCSGPAFEQASPWADRIASVGSQLMVRFADP